MKNSIFFALLFTLFITLPLISMRGPFPDFTECITLSCPIKLIYGFDGRAVRVDDVILRSGKKDCRAYALSAIQEAGYYKLAGNVTTTITIAASSVQLNLGGFTVTGGIIANSNLKDITINNGTVIPSGASNAVTINSGCTGIKIFDVSVQDSGTVGGILMTQAVDSTIRNCEMIQNTTGIMLNQCSNITVQDCAATRNIFAGFSLLTSNTCIVTGCKAISTGADNRFITLTNALGFVSNNGVGNVFDKCIANSTQALTTTDSSSLIAGFALRGTEKGSRITNCAASNAATSIAGLTIPYGIYVEATLASALTATGTPIVPAPLVLANVAGAIVWSPDGKYIAFGGTDNAVRVYKFDRLKTTFTLAAIANTSFAGVIYGIAWSPDGQYIAAVNLVSPFRLRVYRWSATNNSLTQVAAVTPPSGVNISAVAWRPDGKFLTIGQQQTPNIFLYEFDRIVLRLTLVSTLSTGSVTGDRTMSWSPDGNYLAVPSSTAPAGPFILQFNQRLATLTLVSDPTLNFTSVTIQWSPNGQYLAVTATPSGSNDLVIFSFNRMTNTLSLLATVSTGSVPLSVSWSPDGKYIAVGATSNPSLLIFKFDAQAQTLTQLLTLANSNNKIVAWSPDGEFLIATSSASPFVNAYRILTFASGNTIMNNTVFCNSGDNITTQNGVGISGSSTSNWITQNTVYSNATNPPVVDTSYQFATNVYNTLFQDVPTLMQNISIGTCAPIPARPDRVQQMEILLSKLTDIATKVDLIKLK